MKLFILLFAYHTVSGRFIWSNSIANANLKQKDNNFADIFSNLLNDFNLDISFTPNTNSFSNQYLIDNEDTNNIYDSIDVYISINIQ